MKCFHPLKGWRGRKVGPSGKARIVFEKSASCGVAVELRCGQCIGCRLDHSRQWAVRCMHEAALHEDNCFVTLTYRPECLPEDGSLRVRDFQLFLKRLRARFPERRLKFYHCGEYGERTRRPHYHACIFGFDFPDKVLFKETPSGAPLFSSSLCDELWGLGATTVGAVSFESAAYVARYCVAKRTGPDARFHYSRVDHATGEVLGELCPEYVTMSRGGRTGRGIAYEWFQRFGNEVFPSDEVIVRGFPASPPRYYSRLYEDAHADLYRAVVKRRIKRAKLRAGDNTSARLAVQEVCAKARGALLKRSLDTETSR